MAKRLTHEDFHRSAVGAELSRLAFMGLAKQDPNIFADWGLRGQIDDVADLAALSIGLTKAGTSLPANFARSLLEATRGEPLSVAYGLKGHNSKDLGLNSLSIGLGGAKVALLFLKRRIASQDLAIRFAIETGLEVRVDAEATLPISALALDRTQHGGPASLDDVFYVARFGYDLARDSADSRAQRIEAFSRGEFD
jgi:hypothetical protein